ncbi:hypothetical protein PJI17_01895 [Mycobacterium kansasii]
MPETSPEVAAAKPALTANMRDFGPARAPHRSAMPSPNHETSPWPSTPLRASRRPPQRV